MTVQRLSLMAGAFIIALSFTAAPAIAQNASGYSGYSGATPNAAAAAAHPMSSIQAKMMGLPDPNARPTSATTIPVAAAPTVTAPAPATAPVSPLAPSTPTTVAETALAGAPPQKPDPCAAYMADINSYTVCQDRIVKLQRMQDAAAKRNAENNPVVAPPVAAPVAAAPTGGYGYNPAPVPTTPPVTPTVTNPVTGTTTLPPVGANGLPTGINAGVRQNSNGFIMNNVPQ